MLSDTSPLRYWGEVQSSPGSTDSSPGSERPIPRPSECPPVSPTLRTFQDCRDNAGREHILCTTLIHMMQQGGKDSVFHGAMRQVAKVVKERFELTERAAVDAAKYSPQGKLRLSSELVKCERGHEQAKRNDDSGNEYWLVLDTHVCCRADCGGALVYPLPDRLPKRLRL